MYVAPRDMAILRSDEVSELKDRYREKFGAQVYLETLQKAVAADKPYHIVSRRYDEFDH